VQADSPPNPSIAFKIPSYIQSHGSILSHLAIPSVVMSQDSPLSIAASLTGILTFVFALTAGFYARAISLRSAIDTQAEVSSLLEKIDFLETETDMLNNAYLASQIRHPHRTYGTGDFKYFQGLYNQSLQRMRAMDRELRRAAAHVTGGNSYDKMSRVKTAANWMASRNQMHKNIEERKAESSRIFQIQLAMLSAKIDELSYHQNHHNASCSVVLEEIGSLNRYISILPRIDLSIYTLLY
ncbi:hypothetical protein LSUB1_G002911, partial [Lachnellula subtilissima]